MRSYDFYKNRYLALGFSAVLVIIGLLSIFIRGLRLDITFQGGSILNYSYQGSLDEKAVTELARETLGRQVSVQLTENLASTGDSTTRKSFVVNVAGKKALSTEDQTALREAFGKNFADNKVEVGELLIVDPFIGQETLSKGLLAVLISSVLIVAYVWIRFRSISGPSAGVFALLALLHDVIIAFLSFVVFGFAINESVIAVVLSILGWSVNDTIVIYDSVRENERLYRNGQTLPELVNRSILQSISRSFFTSFCGFVAIIVAYVFAAIYNIESIREFALPMAVGLVVGTYSSIFLAAPFWTMWKTRGGRLGYDS